MSASEHRGQEPSSLMRAACLGGGVIGQSWIALFLAAGKSVAVFDPDPRAEQKVRQAVESAWPTLRELGLTEHGDPEGLYFYDDARAAVEGAGLVQESVPERI